MFLATKRAQRTTCWRLEEPMAPPERSPVLCSHSIAQIGALESPPPRILSIPGPWSVWNMCIACDSLPLDCSPARRDFAYYYCLSCPLSFHPCPFRGMPGLGGRGLTAVVGGGRHSWSHLSVSSFYYLWPNGKLTMRFSWAIKRAESEECTS